MTFALLLQMTSLNSPRTWPSLRPSSSHTRSKHFFTFTNFLEVFHFSFVCPRVGRDSPRSHLLPSSTHWFQESPQDAAPTRPQVLHLSGLSLGLSVRLGLGLLIIYLIECSESHSLVHIILAYHSFLMLIKNLIIIRMNCMNILQSYTMWFAMHLYGFCLSLWVYHMNFPLI